MSLLLSAILIILEICRYLLVELFFFRKKTNTTLSARDTISVLQPLLSGDAELWSNLRHNVTVDQNLNTEWIWLVDASDSNGLQGCRQLINDFPNKKIRLVVCPAAPENVNPKVFKLNIGVRATQAKYIAVLDDDTMITPQLLTESMATLKSEAADLVFGLPYYISKSTIWSRLVASFVNSSSLLSYIPYTFFLKPFTINGMYYMTSRQTLVSNDVFKQIENELCDDYAIAQFYSLRGLKLHQTPLLHPLNAKVESFSQFSKLLRRWFLFPMVSLIPQLSFHQLAVFLSSILVPVFTMWTGITLLITVPKTSARVSAFLLLLTKTGILALVNKRYLNNVDSVLSMVCMQLITPLYILLALIGPREITWRDKRIKVLPSNKMRIIS
ncbi:MAG: glycosyltransferase [Anaerolineae bacterium]|nr:glycosyltransferase [Anaerolineae bacterium]